ncbi:DUF4129 domain-containing protein [Nocardia crassostreae]|uniref:DUF4129 domain-containing protein n=1 Tax=Nocardia crassostreae TaxID=53428 RepID=UPI002481474D|nr:DUF4129 domain-containing protein [Nocardia crassostreae]
MASRAIGLIALLMLAVVALRGHIPGTGGPSAPHPPSAVALALMPVLLLVSAVILVAGVINSQHHLPLSMPEPQCRPDRRSWGLGGIALAALIGLVALILLAAAALSVYLVGPGRDETTVAPETPPVTTAPAVEPLPPPEAPIAAPPLGGAALLLVAIGAGVLVLVAIAGLVVVAVTSSRRPAPASGQLGPAKPAEAVSLAKVAAMGLAAMTAPGQDPRTAIIACYVAMEHGLSTAREVAPLASDTPSEVLARAFDRGFLHDASARELVALFEEARFSPHSMLQWQRMRAEQLLRIVLADLQGQAA